MAHPAPAHVGDVKKAVDTAQVHEGSEIGDVLNDPGADLVFRQLVDELFLELAPGLFQDLSAAYHDVAAPLVELDHPEVQLLAAELLEVGHLPEATCEPGRRASHPLSSR